MHVAVPAAIMPDVRRIKERASHRQCAAVLSRYGQAGSWPKQSYRHVKSDVGKAYHSRWLGVLTCSGSLIVFFLLSNLLAVPVSIQDMILHMCSTVAIGYTALLHLQLFDIYPVLIIVPTLLFAAIAYFVVIAVRATAEMEIRHIINKLQSVASMARGGGGGLSPDKKYTVEKKTPSMHREEAEAEEEQYYKLDESAINAD